MPKSREEDFKRNTVIWHFLPENFLPFGWWVILQFFVALPYRFYTPTLVKIGPVVLEKKMLTHDGRRRRSTHNNRSAEWLRWLSKDILLPSKLNNGWSYWWLDRWIGNCFPGERIHGFWKTGLDLWFILNTIHALYMYKHFFILKFLNLSISVAVTWLKYCRYVVKLYPINQWTLHFKSPVNQTVNSLIWLQASATMVNICLRIFFDPYLDINIILYQEHYNI